MIIDRLLYLVVPRVLHEWAADNRAKVRAYVLGALAPVGVVLIENYAPEEWSAVLLTVLFSGGAVTVGRQTHKVVEPWDQDA